MLLVLLVTQEMNPLPEALETVEDYGNETLHLSGGQTVSGKVMVLRGDDAVFKEWLRPFDGVWLSPNPMVGNWEVCHIK